MHRRQLLAGAAVAALAGVIPAVAAPRRSKPNFVLILCDDLGYGDIAPFGNRYLKTPNLQRMAKEGLTLTDYYAAANICSPSRAALLTGRYAIRTTVWNVLLVPDKTGLPLSEVTIGQALKPEYATALIGKWHLGHADPYWPPTRHGFDYFFGIPYSHDMSPLSLYEAQGEQVRTVEAEADHPRLQQHFAEQAEAFIERNKDRPFFLELALSAPHLPEYPRPPFEGTTPVGAYGDVVEEIDDIVGRVVTKLKALGLDEDTLVVFTSDNGPWFEGSTGGLRDRKASGAWDGAFRVPFIARWPGRIPANAKSSALAMGIDFLPTFCSLAGKPPPAGVKLDGKDITKVLIGQGPSPHDELLLFNDEDIAGIRTDRWKLVVETYYRDHRVDLIPKYHPKLFDMKLDPSESYSVDALHPDVTADMMARWQAARREFEPLRRHGSPFTRPPPPTGRVQD